MFIVSSFSQFIAVDLPDRKSYYWEFNFSNKHAVWDQTLHRWNTAIVDCTHGAEIFVQQISSTLTVSCNLVSVTA